MNPTQDLFAKQGGLTWKKTVSYRCHYGDRYGSADKCDRKGPKRGGAWECHAPIPLPAQRLPLRSVRARSRRRRLVRSPRPAWADRNDRASAGTQTALALAPGSRARTFVGSIEGREHRPFGRASGSVKSITAIAARPGSSVCAAIGTTGIGGSNASGHAGHVLVFDVGFARRHGTARGNSGVVC